MPHYQVECFHNPLCTQTSPTEACCMLYAVTWAQQQSTEQFQFNRTQNACDACAVNRTVQSL